MAKQTEDFKYRGRSSGVTALTTSFADIVTGGADDSDLTEFTLVNAGAGARSVTIQCVVGGVSAIILLISVPANAGNSTSITSPAIELIKGGSVSGLAQLPGVEMVGTTFIYPLPFGAKLQAKQDAGTDISVVWKMKNY